MAAEFCITDEPVSERTHVVAVRGEIDLFTAPEFKQRIAAPIDAGKANIVVDLSEVTFIDSSSLGVLIGAHKRLKLRDGQLVIVAAARPIVHTFQITGLDAVFTLVATRAAALGEALQAA